MWDKIVEFFTSVPLWELVMIFALKNLEVSMGTLRVILINKGYRKQGMVLGFFEVLIWLFVAGSVLSGIAELPLKAIVYCLAFSTGVFLGSKLESRLAFGKVLIQAIVPMDTGVVIAAALRSQGYGVTTIKAQGKDTEKTVLMVYANRKGKDSLVNKIKAIDEHAMIVSNDVSTLSGGYITSWRRITK